MPTKVLFAFAGTGDTAKKIHKKYEREAFKPEVVRVYFNGCQSSAIGGAKAGIGYISPNLDTVASKVRSCFDEKGELSLSKLKKQFGDAIIIEPDSDKPTKVDDINLIGFSRGAVTTFAAAQHLDDLGIPISLFAEDPVPGNSKEAAKKISSEFYKNHDLRHCKNLQHAEVLIGAYKHSVNPLQNKFYRQMAPLFNEKCDAAIYTVPKTYHRKISHLSDNHRTDFLARRGTVGISYFDEDAISFVPKLFQQKYHIGVAGRIQLSTRYKELLYKKISVHHSDESRDASIKSGQALHALDIAPKFLSKDTLYQSVKEDTSSKGKALREFIVEFENINQYVFRKTKSEKIDRAINKFRVQVYEHLSAFPVSKATAMEKRAFEGAILSSLQSIKAEIPKKQYSELNKMVSTFLKDNIVVHPDLTQYLDESETYKSKPTSFKDADSAMININNVKNGDQLAELLYHMSENSRDHAYDKLSKNLSALVQDANQLGNVMRFLPAKNIEKILKKPEMKALIGDLKALNGIMNKMFKPEQRMMVYNAVKHKIKNMHPTFEQLGELMQYVSADQCKALMKTTPFTNITSKSSVDIIDLFKQLNSKQFNKLLPELTKSIGEYLAKRLGKDKGIELKAFLKSQKCDGDVKKAIDTIFPEKPCVIETQRSLKSQLTTVVKESQDKESSVILKT